MGFTEIRFMHAAPPLLHNEVVERARCFQAPGYTTQNVVNCHYYWPKQLKDHQNVIEIGHQFML